MTKELYDEIPHLGSWDSISQECDALNSFIKTRE